MSYLDDFLGNTIANSNKTLQDQADESRSLKIKVEDLRQRNEDQAEINRIAERDYANTISDYNKSNARLRTEYMRMMDSRDKFAKSMNLLKEEKKALLSKPLYEAVKENENWDLSYDSITSKLATSHVFKEAYKELAIKYGGEKGVSRDEIYSIVTDKALNVFKERLNEINKMIENPGIEDEGFMTMEVLPKDRVERIIEKLKGM